MSINTIEETKLAVIGDATVLANMRTDSSDSELIDWAQRHNRFVRIDRESMWGNPWRIDERHDRDCVCDLYERYAKERWRKWEIDKLRGKVLGCWCSPERCHGETLLRLLGMETPDRSTDQSLPKTIQRELF